MALDPATLAIGARLDGRSGSLLYVALPALPGPAADEDRQGGVAGAAGGGRAGVRERPGRIRGRSVPGGDDRHGRAAGRPAAARDPRPLDAQRSHLPAARRADGRAGGRGAEQGRAGEADRGRARHRPRRRIRPGQAGNEIAEEAERINAAAIVVQLNYRNGKPLYSKTLETVLGERPCRVIVVAKPEPVVTPGQIDPAIVRETVRAMS